MTAPIRRVWIEEGCIACNLCQDTVPDVFLVEATGSCIIKPEAARHFEAHAEDIRDAARDCPVEVIKVEEA